MTSPISFYESVFQLCKETALWPERERGALLLAGVMRWFAVLRGHEEEADYWAAAGLLYPMEEASPPSVAALRRAGADDRFLTAIDAREFLTTADEFTVLLVTLSHLTRLIDAIAAARPRHSVKGLKVSAVQKKFRDWHFVPEVSRALIRDGARHLKWEIGDLTSKTIKAILTGEEMSGKTARTA